MSLSPNGWMTTSGRRVRNSRARVSARFTMNLFSVSFMAPPLGFELRAGREHRPCFPVIIHLLPNLLNVPAVQAMSEREAGERLRRPCGKLHEISLFADNVDTYEERWPWRLLQLGRVLLGELHLQLARSSRANVFAIRGLHLCIEYSITRGRVNQVDDEVLDGLLLTKKVILEPRLPITPFRDQKPENRLPPFADVVPL